MSKYSRLDAAARRSLREVQMAYDPELPTDHLVQFSGGIGSWATATRVRDAIMKEGDTLTLLFADTMMEDEDLYRFLGETAESVGGELVRVADGRDVWQVFKDERVLGNSMMDPCSRILKRELLWNWIKRNRDARRTLIHIGVDWTEVHRYDRARERALPWTLRAPLTEKPLIDKEEMLGALRATGIRPPRLYSMGFPHNNCGGFCVKAGQGQFVLLLRTMPDRFAYHERREQELREFLGRNVSILKDRRGGEAKPMTLRELRERVERGEKVGRDMGGCGCALD